MSSTDLDTLVAMGFEQSLAQRALMAGKNLSNALDWLQNYQEQDHDKISTEQQNISSTDELGSARSIICTDCLKKFRNVTDAEYHGAKSGHTDFAESEESIAPLTQEEKAARLDELRAKVALKRSLRSDQDKQDQKRNEEIRRKSTREAQDIKDQLKSKERLKDAARKKQEKLDDILAKQRIRDKIAADKEERKARTVGVANKSSHDAAQIKSPAESLTKPKMAVDYSESRLRLQMPASTLIKTFAAEATLQDVVKVISEEVKGFEASSFMQTFPKKSK